MAKIVIATILDNINTGTFLQALALGVCVRKLGHNPVLVNYSRPHLRFVYLVKNVFRNQSKSFFRKGLSIINISLEQILRMRLKHIVRKVIPMCSLNTLSKIDDRNTIYMTGSDQVWAQLLDNINNEGFFLNFGSSQIKRISYAASFAMTSYPQELKKKLKDKLSIFSAISVRESSGVEICKELGYNVSWVLDPTFLLEQSDYLSLKLKNKNSSPYAFVYFVNINSKENIYWKEVKKYLHQQNYAIYMTSASGYNNKRIHFSGCRYLYPTIEEWLSLIYYSQIMITSSFHGVALSIILNREFVFFPLGGAYSEGNNRVTDLLTLLGLTERIIYRKSDLIYILSKKIEWHSVNRKLDSLRKKSKNFLSVLDDENFIYCNNTNLQ